MAKTTAQQLMEAETRVSYGPIPDHMLDGALNEMSWRMTADEFLLRGIVDHYFYYRCGEGITVSRGAGADPADEPLWLNGSVYAAIASMNGLLPIHASAVAHGRRVFAFAGPAGAGKSTLIAGLGNHGLPMFCDDTLILDLSDPEQIVCLPGHKRLKLTPEAVDLAGATVDERVAPSVDKYYASPTAGEVGVALPLAELIFLEDGPEASIATLSGAERFMRLQDDHYTSQLFAAARQFDRSEMFTHFASLARRIRMAEFVRPVDQSRFNEGVAIAAQYVTRSAES